MLAFSASLVDYVIPANDDAPRSIKVLIDYLAASVNEGKQKAATRKIELAAERKAKTGTEKTDKHFNVQLACALFQDRDAITQAKAMHDS